MATARVPRICAAVSSIGNLTTTSSTSYLCQSPQRRSHLFPTRCRPKIAQTMSQLSARNFSTTARTLSDAVEPLRQESEATANQRSETREQRQTGAAESAATVAAAQPHNSVGQTTAPEPNAPTANPSPPSSRPHSPIPQRTQSSDGDSVTISRRITGTVIRTHTMTKTVAVATTRQYFDRFLQKHYTRAAKTLVHDPNETLVEGDVIEYGLFPAVERAQRIKMGKGKRVKYVVVRVVTPFGVPLEQRGKGTVTPVETSGGREDGEVRELFNS